jgi:hypothetical protein
VPKVYSYERYPLTDHGFQEEFVREYLIPWKSTKSLLGGYKKLHLPFLEHKKGMQGTSGQWVRLLFMKTYYLHTEF